MDRLLDRLDALSGQRPPKPFVSRFSPDLAYGRHRGPVPRGARQAAVLAAIYWPAGQEPRLAEPVAANLFDGARLILTRRPHFLTHHAGQVCLPGGRIEAGEDGRQAALREFEEELGIRPAVRRELGVMSRLYVYASDNIVEPHVVWIDEPEAEWRPDPSEVDEVVTWPLGDVLLAARAGGGPGRERRAVRLGTECRGHVEFLTPQFGTGNRRVWGATAMILDELAHHLLSLSNPDGPPAN